MYYLITKNAFSKHKIIYFWYKTIMHSVIGPIAQRWCGSLLRRWLQVRILLGPLMCHLTDTSEGTHYNSSHH